MMAFTPQEIVDAETFARDYETKKAAIYAAPVHARARMTADLRHAMANGLGLTEVSVSADRTQVWVAPFDMKVAA